MIRNIAFYATFVPATVILGVLAWIFGPALGYRVSMTCQAVWAWLAVRVGGVDIHIQGLENLDRQTAYLFVGNHQSLLDIPVLMHALAPWKLRFVAKESLFRIPVFGPGMRRAGHVSIDRGNQRKAIKSINQAADKLGRGMSVVIFPEGTRAPDPETLQDFNIGAMVLALKTGAPTVPVLIRGTSDLTPKGKLGVRPGKVRIRILEPFRPAEEYGLKQREELKERVWNTMNRAYLEMGSGGSGHG